MCMCICYMYMYMSMYTYIIIYRYIIIQIPIRVLLVMISLLSHYARLNRPHLPSQSIPLKSARVTECEYCSGAPRWNSKGPTRRESGAPSSAMRSGQTYQA